MDKKVADLLKEQVNKEFYSSYLYLAYSNYYMNANLDGFGNWFMVQAQEELDHALKFLKYLQDNNEEVTLGAIAAPNISFSDSRQPLVAALEHEKFVTSSINAIYRQAREVDDYRCTQFLDWFIAEQAEEEKSTGDLIARYDLLGGDPKSMYLLNAELATRTYTPTTTTAE